MREIITLQFGTDANFVGSHFWNVQESYYDDSFARPAETITGAGTKKSETVSTSPSGLDLVDHDVHFRSGIGADGQETYLPRTLIYDARYQFGALRKENALYSMLEEDSGDANNPTELWQGKTVAQTEMRVLPSGYTTALDAADDGDPVEHSKAKRNAANDQTIRFWSDYLHVYYHPRSLFPLTLNRTAASVGPSFRTANSEASLATPQSASAGAEISSRNASSRSALDLDYSDGDEIWQQMDGEADSGNSWESEDFRRFLEESDYPQGVQVMANMTGPWGNVTGRAVERIRDDHAKMNIWVWGIEGPGASTRSHRMKTALNLAQSLHALLPSASMYVPIRSTPPPSWARLTNSTDELTAWRVSALQAMAIESTLLPTRLHQSSGAATIDSITSTLNLTGHRTIAGLEAEVLLSSEHDGKMENDEGVRMKYNFFDADGLAPPGRRRKGKKDQVFATVRLDRGDAWKSDRFASSRLNEGSNDPYQLQTIRSLSTPLEFPIVETYPDIFTPASSTSHASVRTTLTASSAVSRRLGNLSDFVRRSGRGMITLTEREELASELDTLKDEYKERWESDSDESDS